MNNTTMPPDMYPHRINVISKKWKIVFIISAVFFALMICVIAVFFGAEKKPPTATKKSEHTVSIANPMKLYQSREDIHKIMGFEVLAIPENEQTLFIPSAYYVIGEKIAQINYHTHDSDGTVSVRTALGSDDISGVYGIRYGDADTVHGMEIHSGFLDGIYVAWFSSEGKAYAVTASGISESSFESLVTHIIESFFK